MPLRRYCTIASAKPDSYESNSARHPLFFDFTRIVHLLEGSCRYGCYNVSMASPSVRSPLCPNQPSALQHRLFGVTLESVI